MMVVLMAVYFLLYFKWFEFFFPSSLDTSDEFLLCVYVCVCGGERCKTWWEPWYVHLDSDFWDAKKEITSNNPLNIHTLKETVTS